MHIMAQVVSMKTLKSTTLSKITIIQFEAMVKYVQAQLKKHGKDFVIVVSYLGHMDKEKGCNVQFVQITTTKSKSVMPVVATFMRKIALPWSTLKFYIQRTIDAGGKNFIESKASSPS